MILVLSGGGSEAQGIVSLLEGKNPLSVLLSNLCGGWRIRKRKYNCWTHFRFQPQIYCYGKQN